MRWRHVAAAALGLVILITGGATKPADPTVAVGSMAARPTAIWDHPVFFLMAVGERSDRA